MPASRWNVLLHQRGRVYAQINFVVCRRVFQLFHAVVADDARAAAADIGFDHDGKAQTLCGKGREAAVIDNMRGGIGQSERVQQLQLQRLAGFISKRLNAIDNPNPLPFQMRQPAERVKQAVAAVAQVRGGTHAVEHKRICLRLIP